MPHITPAAITALIAAAQADECAATTTAEAHAWGDVAASLGSALDSARVALRARDAHLALLDAVDAGDVVLVCDGIRFLPAPAYAAV